MKGLLWGIVIIVLAGIGGLVYRNAAEHPTQKIACPLDAKQCPDGSFVSRTGSSCTFPACPPPNVALAAAQVAFAIPAGFASTTLGTDPTLVAAYQEASSTASSTARITIRQYPVAASSTPLETIQKTAAASAVGTQIFATSFTSTLFGVYRFTVVTVTQTVGTIDTAYYLSRGTNVLRFDAIDSGVTNWNDPTIVMSELPAHAALKQLLSTLQVMQS